MSEHEFMTAGDGTREIPHYLRCKRCGYPRTLVPSTYDDVGCIETMREFNRAKERAEFGNHR